MIKNFPNGGITSYDDVPEALETYTKVLKEQADKSVTIVSLGFPINIRNVLEAEPDLFE